MLKRKLLSLSSLIIIPAATLPAVSCAKESTVHFGYIKAVTQEDIDKFVEELAGPKSTLISNEGNTKLEAMLMDKKSGESITETELGVDVEAFNLKPGTGYRMVVEKPYGVRIDPDTGKALPKSIIIRVTIYSLSDRSLFKDKAIVVVPREELNLSEVAKLFISSTSSKTAEELGHDLGRKMQATAAELGYTEPDFATLLPHQNKLPDGSYDPKLIYPELIKAVYKFSMNNHEDAPRASIRIIVKISHGDSKVISNTAYFILKAKP